MEAICISGNREMVLRVLQRETQEHAVLHGLPSFACSVGAYTLGRDGRLTVEEDRLGVLPLLSSLGLCSQHVACELASPEAITYPTEGHDGRSLLNLFSILSSRQQLLNQALAAPRSKAFFVAPTLMDDLLAHPPITVTEFLQTLYGRDEEFSGVRISLDRIELTGFQRCKQDESPIHRQLADRIIATALTLRWAKSYTRNVRNRKYAFRTWLNAIGMVGPEYAEARQVMLNRLYGWTDRRGVRR